MLRQTSTQSIKILVVDDLPEKLLVYRSILDELGEEVLTARSGEEALRLILDHDFAVILLDVNMPGMDGFETAAMIRRRARSAHTPIIFITAFADEMHAARGYSLGAVDYILAPVMPEVLRTKVGVFVDLNRLTHQVREQAARQLAQAATEQARMAAELDNAADFVGRADAAGRLLSVNLAGRRMLGLEPSAPLPLMIDECLTPAAQAIVREDGLPIAQREGVWFGELSLATSDGREIPVSQVILGHRDERGELESYSIIARDISERRAAEAELARHHVQLEELVNERTAELHASLDRLRLADRLASIGTLAAGLGHDMGNLLLPIRMRLDTLEKLDLPNSVREDLQAIKTAGEYLQRLCKGLRLFALDPDDEGGAMPRTHFAQWWTEVEPFLRNSLRKGIHFECHWPADLPPILIPPHRFTQVIYNLVQNANDALHDDEAGKVSIDASLSSDGERVVLLISDDGAGMSLDVKRRCLEPFFTTKTRGISTGLGLALVHGAVSKSQGTVDIESEPGRGTKFTITLPVLRVTAGIGEERAAPPSRARAWIALDDKRLRAYVVSMLRSLEVDARVGDWPPDDDVNLLILDVPNGHRMQFDEFLTQDTNRQAIILGGRIESDLSQQIISMSAKPLPSELRAAINAMLHQDIAAGVRAP